MDWILLARIVLWATFFLLIFGEMAFAVGLRAFYRYYTRRHIELRGIVTEERRKRIELEQRVGALELRVRTSHGDEHHEHS